MLRGEQVLWWLCLHFAKEKGHPLHIRVAVHFGGLEEIDKDINKNNKSYPSCCAVCFKRGNNINMNVNTAHKLSPR